MVLRAGVMVMVVLQVVRFLDRRRRQAEGAGEGVRLVEEVEPRQAVHHHHHHHYTNTEVAQLLLY